MKRTISLLLALALCLGLAACTASTTAEPNTDQTAATQPEQTESNASQTTGQISGNREEGIGNKFGGKPPIPGGSGK